MNLNQYPLYLLGSLLLTIFSISFGFSQTTAIPDTNFEQELINLGIDSNGLNGNILNTDALAVSTLSLGGTLIINISGIEAFTNLTSLNLGSNPVANINLNTLTQLTDFVTDNNDALVSINLTQNLLLENVFIESDINIAGDSPINIIDISQNTSLITLQVNHLRNLTDLILPVTSTLTSITISNLADPTLDFSLLDGLEILSVRGSTVPVSIILPSEQAILKRVYLSSFLLPIVDVSNFINLEQLDLHNTYLESLILPTTNTFKRLTIWHHNFINPVSLANVPEIEYVDIRFNQTVPLVIDLLNNPLIGTLWLTHNDLNSVDLTQITNLDTLWIYDNNLTALDVTQNLLLQRLWANDNLLLSIDLTQNTVLRYLNLADNQLPNLNVTQNPLLSSADISNNLFTGTGLDLTQNMELNYVKASFNQIESLDITQNIRLSSLIVDHNLFSGTSILDQYYTLRLNDNNIYGGSLEVSFNLLSGMVPDYASLIDGDVDDGNQTRRFSLLIDNNYFEFGHFENQHADYVVFDNTIGPPPFNSPVIDVYAYAPQAKVDIIEVINANAGDAITLTTVCAGAQNHYTWFKDGIAIPGALDAPSYTIPSVNSCDQAVYHSEVTSDLVPFENANPPGTNRRNLLLVRNDITLNVNSPVESCVSLISPANGSVLVPINEILSWTENFGACGYYISIGTTSGGTDILNNVDVGDVNSYVLATNFPPNTQVFVTITPYFASGVALICSEESFTTDSIPTIASCTTLISPFNGEINVLVTSDITWTSILNASGYFITIGTSAGASDIANGVDVGNTTTYNPPTDFPENTQIFVSITPYNTAGNAVGCVEESFTTEGSLAACTSLISPLNGDINISVATNITWNAITNATGYLITIGTSSGASDLANAVDVGNTTTYNPPTDFPENTQIFVSITPYNTAGNAVACTEESFTTEVLIPTCTILSSPFNGETNVLVTSNITWNAIANATGYLITIGTSSGASDLANGVDVGNTTTYNPPTDFPENTQIFVTITPYNTSGNATACTEESFTTEVLTPTCTILSSPFNGETDVLMTSNITWNVIANATGYLITIGTSSGASDLANGLDVGNTTTYNPPTDFPENTQIFVSITPYNSSGNAVACTEESFTTEVLIPTCTTLSSPFNGETDVLVSSNITWNAIANATGYLITIGTSSGASDLANGLDVGNTTTYNPPTDLPENTQIFVTITPYNTAGNAVACTEESFTTEVLIPTCTTLSSPFNGETNVLVSSNITWNTIANATGYLVTIGTSSGASDLVNGLDVGNTTTYNPPTDFPENTQIFVTITPYNTSGNAVACTEESFITEVLIPACTSLSSPFNGETDVLVSSNITWNAIANATGYLITIGTSSGASDLVNGLDVGNTTTYNPPTDFPENTQIFVSITPYNTSGNAVGCFQESFTTESLQIIVPKFFTPNNDGYNDVWRIEDPKKEIKSIYIFDRYGKLLRNLTSNSEAWDGTFQNRNLKTDDYWYRIILMDGNVKTGHFTLKR